MTIHIAPKVDTKNVEKALLDNEGKLKVVPAKILQSFTQLELSTFCVLNGFYCLPTIELIDFLKEELVRSGITENNRHEVVEIGSGQGTIAKALGIPACDNFMQENPAIKEHYAMLKQQTVPYDHDYVLKQDADSYIAEKKPSIVIGAWVTHQYDPKEAWREGNALGIDEKAIVEKCKYIFIGNSKVHAKKPIFDLPHREVKFDFGILFSRSLSSSGKNSVWIWN